jgi:hypothetical protein
MLNIYVKVDKNNYINIINKMNFIFDINDFQIENMHLFEKKKNIVVDGIFTKIIYSDKLLSMNGIYLNFPLEITSNQNIYNNKNVYFYSYTKMNAVYIKELSQIEEYIVNYYKHFYNVNKENSMVFAKQLQSGFFKLYREQNTDRKCGTVKYVLKISGIWETKNEIGITFKLLEMYDSI